MPGNAPSYCFGMSFPRGLGPQSPCCSGDLVFERELHRALSVFGVRHYAWQLWSLANEARGGSPEGMGSVQLAWTFVFSEALEWILVMDCLALQFLSSDSCSWEQHTCRLSWLEAAGGCSRAYMSELKIALSR